MCAYGCVYVCLRVRVCRVCECVRMCVCTDVRVCQHLPGPTTLRKHPSEHASVTVLHANPLTANDVLVVYRRNATDQVVRNIIYGPVMHVPQVMCCPLLTHSPDG